MLDGTTFIGNFKYLNIQFLFLGNVCIVFDIDLDKPYNKLPSFYNQYLLTLEKENKR